MTDQNHFHDLCRLRSTLEAFAVQGWRRSAGRERVGDELRGLLKKLKKHASAGDYAAFHQTDQQFQRTIVAAAGLDPLLKSWESIVSVSHLNRLFRSRLGISPLRYLKQVRLERAAQLLRSGTDAVALIARRVGYRNASHFVRDFRRMFGVTPLEHRRQGNP